MSVFIAIVGLALLVLIHEAGHFFAARAVGMTPRKFYLGFGPPIARTRRGGVEYGIGSIPLGGYVKIPGMSRPSPGGLAAMLTEAQQVEHRAELARLDAAIEDGDDPAARAALEELRPAYGSTAAWQELEGQLAPDAYWRQHTWRRLVAIAAGPAVNLVFAIVLFTCLFVVATTHDTKIIGRVLPNTPAAAAGVQKGDLVVAVAGARVPLAEIPARIRATDGRRFTLVVNRNGRRVAIPLRARLSSGAYRIGVEFESRTGAGESVPAAARDALGLTWDVTSSTVTGIGHLFAGRGTNQVSSSVGIVRVSAAAWREGLRNFLLVLGFVSLALGLLNLLPVLPLDGGHIVIALVEKVRGHTFKQSVYLRYTVVGLTLFGVLMYFGLRNDLFGGGG